MLTWHLDLACFMTAQIHAETCFFKAKLLKVTMTYVIISVSFFFFAMLKLNVN